MREIGHFVGGKQIKGASGRTGDVFQPMTGDIIAKVALASKAELGAPSKTPRRRSLHGPPPTRSAARASCSNSSS